MVQFLSDDRDYEAFLSAWGITPGGGDERRERLKYWLEKNLFVTSTFSGQ